MLIENSLNIIATIFCNSLASKPWIVTEKPCDSATKSIFDGAKEPEILLHRGYSSKTIFFDRFFYELGKTGRYVRVTRLFLLSDELLGRGRQNCQYFRTKVGIHITDDKYHIAKAATKEILLYSINLTTKHLSKIMEVRRRYIDHFKINGYRTKY
uniref:Uncharacterized protein n=1 Tax=Romanomermis culicivorax TaxID=13658 RepID=A0A915KTQ4_ROMCU